MQTNTINFHHSQVCCPLLEEDLTSIKKIIHLYQRDDYDIIEVRYDYFKEDITFKQLQEILEYLKANLNGIKILFTIRSKKDSGKFTKKLSEYQSIINFVVYEKLVDIIDIEFNFANSILNEIQTSAKINNIATIISYHNFNGILSKNEFFELFIKIHLHNPDLVKIALMPTCENDFLLFLNYSLKIKDKFSNTNYALILMGNLGVFSRYNLKFLNSKLTFVSCLNQSAPGQLLLDDYHTIIKILENNS